MNKIGTFYRRKMSFVLFQEGTLSVWVWLEIRDCNSFRLTRSFTGFLENRDQITKIRTKWGPKSRSFATKVPQGVFCTFPYH